MVEMRYLGIHFTYPEVLKGTYDTVKDLTPSESLAPKLSAYNFLTKPVISQVEERLRESLRRQVECIIVCGGDHYTSGFP